ncbi:E3 SUMO-protein ligase ZBED1-like [Melitaea cinxia]|uniref:E3 SUMO-protein ligase ZBED1-like n=1 Tax=Melitaea cinxia TaxID=113334 RepID=UPI001E273674|nr:E3 SUMO-protein ligase ZBED1-like [Melitaea cinxia]
MVTKGHHSFTLVDEPEFRKLLDMVSTCLGYNLPTRKTLSNTLIPKYYTEVFETILQKVKESFDVCLCTDAWTSSNTQFYIAVTAHYIDHNTEMQSILLGCLNYNDRHTSENLVAFLRQMMQDWQITHKVRCVVIDNAANIQAAIRLGDWRSVGCFRHGLNLCVQNALKSIADVLEKVKAIVEHFKRSYTAQSKLEAILKQMDLPVLKLKQECPTRWNSCYEMLLRMIKIKHAIISTLALIRSDLSLQNAEWDLIEKVIPILKPFYEITQEISTEKYVSLSKALVFTNLMCKHVAKEILSQNNAKIKILLEKLQNQLLTRFHDLESNVLYSNSCILDPRFKKRGFRTPEAFERALGGLKRRIGHIRIINIEEPTVQKMEPPQNLAEPSIWDEFDAADAQVTRPLNATAAGIRELDKYVEQDNLNRKKNPLKWWHARKDIYPHLYQLMLKRLCIQATSVSCESFFSGAGLLINDRRK